MGPFFNQGYLFKMPFYPHLLFHILVDHKSVPVDISLKNVGMNSAKRRNHFYVKKN